MQVKIITLKFDPFHGGFNDEVVQAFTKDKEIVSIKDYFFLKNDVPYLTLMIQYAWTQSNLSSEKFQAQPPGQPFFCLSVGFLVNSKESSLKVTGGGLREGV